MAFTFCGKDASPFPEMRCLRNEASDTPKTYLIVLMNRIVANAGTTCLDVRDVFLMFLAPQ